MNSTDTGARAFATGSITVFFVVGVVLLAVLYCHSQERRRNRGAVIVGIAESGPVCPPYADPPPPYTETESTV